MWTDIRLEGGQVLHWATLAFPPEGSCRDADWVQELADLDKDIEFLSQLASPPCSALFLCAGDLNMQPDGLGTSPETSRLRQRTWVSFLKKFGFCVFNPVPQGLPPVPIHLATSAIDMCRYYLTLRGMTPAVLAGLLLSLPTSPSTTASIAEAQAAVQYVIAKKSAAETTSCCK